MHRSYLLLRRMAGVGGLLLLASCGGLSGLSPELRPLKSRCVAGDMQACAEIGHIQAAKRRGF